MAAKSAAIVRVRDKAIEYGLPKRTQSAQSGHLHLFGPLAAKKAFRSAGETGEPFGDLHLALER